MDIAPLSPSSASGTVWPPLGGPDPDVFRFDLRKPVEPYSSYSLDTAPDDNMATCERCVRVVKYASPPEAPRHYFQASGSLSLQAADGSVGALNNTVLVEVDVDPETSRSTPVPGGDCLVIVAAEWHLSCDDGGIEHTGSGACPLCIHQAYKSCCLGEAARCNSSSMCVGLYACSASCEDDACRQQCLDTYPDAVDEYNDLAGCLFGEGSASLGACGAVCE